MTERQKKSREKIIKSELEKGGTRIKIKREEVFDGQENEKKILFLVSVKCGKYIIL